ncbi:MAG TPA: hypothetical protein PK878_02850 [bacterium]|nr:hypothetical protein [Candidatus Omnitrophota bacterium]HOJ59201.1 hypothetical protein [bacterium]HOL94493.1 hypothetical protein [bacterium]HPP00033.1 hypothetical protein [bacterium]HXK92348.1 hypothetical protein [bacterium]
MQYLADVIASILRIPGEALRELTMAIPLWMARGFFLLYFAILLVWILTMKRSEIVGNLEGRDKPLNLRPYAAAAIILQMIIYAYF